MGKNFKDEFYKRLTDFSLSVVKFCSKVRKDRDLYRLADQLLRSGTSVGANITEAKSCGTKKEYIRYFQIALKSANESSYWLYLIKESSVSFCKEAEGLSSELREISAIIAKGIKTMKGE